MRQVPVWKYVVIVATLLISFWALLPSFEFYSLDEQYRHQSKAEQEASARMNDLDAQVAEVQGQIEAAHREGSPDQVSELEKKLADLRSEFDEAKEAKDAAREEHDNLRSRIINLGLDLQGGVHVVLQVDRQSALENARDVNPEMVEKNPDMVVSDALEKARAVVENRINKYGVTEPIIQAQPPDRIIVEIPGVENPDEVAGLLQTEAQLSFHILADIEDARDIIADIDDRTAVDLTQICQEKRGMTPSSEFLVADADVSLVSAAISSPAAKSVIPDKYIFGWSALEADENYSQIGRHRKLYVMNAKPDLTGGLLRNAYFDLDPSGFNEPLVYLIFNPRGRDILARVSENNVGKRMAIVLDDRVYLAPVLKDRITGGTATIEGITDRNEANRLSIVLRAGALPAKLNLAENRVVGPSLGHDSIQQGVQSAFWGLVVVAAFMIVYYAWAGVVANAALVLNFVFLLAALALFKATLTLPGVAGAVLIIGMAVDANVLIYERIREELSNQRTKSLKAVVEKGYNRAFLTIFDSNLTTLLTAVVLFQFGTGPIRGFAVTLMLGILISMFTALFVTRLIFDSALATGKFQGLSVGRIRLFDNLQWRIVDHTKFPVIGSITVILLGVVFMFIHGGLNQGIDFAGGSLVRVEFAKPTAVEEIRDALREKGHEVGSITIQRVADAKVSGTEFHIKTKSLSEMESDTSQQHLIAQKIVDDLTEVYGQSNRVEVRSIEEVGSAVGHDLAIQGFWCVVAGSLLILAYITLRFEFRFAVAAVVAVVHDVLVTVALFAIFNWEFNLPIIAALLTIVGYSLNDTIVIFDRIRENYTSAVQNFREIVNNSINQCMSRTVITSATTFFVVVVMLIFGGDILRLFVAALCIGVVVGCYSTVFIAAPVLLNWRTRKRSVG